MNKISTMEDLGDEFWKRCNDLLKKYVDMDYISLACQLAKQEETAPDNEKDAWRLLSLACAMRVQSKGRRADYVPAERIGKFTKEKLTFFSKVLGRIDDDRLKARLTDIIWEAKWEGDGEHGPMHFVKVAIESYGRISLDFENWFKYGHECLARLLYLAFHVQQKEEIKEDLRKKIIDKITTADNKNYAYTAQMARLFIGYAPDTSSTVIADKLREVADERMDRKEYWRDDAIYEDASHWYKKGHDEEKAVQMRVFQADAIIKQASSMSAIAGISEYNKAIQILNKIPRSCRTELGVDEKIKQCKIQIEQLRSKIPGEMHKMEYSIDVSEIAMEARKHVSRRSQIEALTAFIGMCSFVSQEEMKAKVERFSLSHFMTRIQYSSDGRQIGSKYASKESQESRDDYIDLVHTYREQIQLTAEACIRPALQVIQTEHRVLEKDFLSIVEQVRFISHDYAILIAKGLYAGFMGDYATALYILAPQFENFIRTILKHHNICTIVRDNEGNENEKRLSTLVQNSKLEQILGKDIVFEIKTCFCDSYGPNIRNNVAHGLDGFQRCNSAYYVYAWWFILKVFISLGMGNKYSGFSMGTN